MEQFIPPLVGGGRGTRKKMEEDDSSIPNGNHNRRISTASECLSVTSEEDDLEAGGVGFAGGSIGPGGLKMLEITRYEAAASYDSDSEETTEAKEPPPRELELLCPAMVRAADLLENDEPEAP